MEKWCLLTIPGMGGGGMKENGGGGRFKYLMYCKNFHKCYNVSPPSTTVKNKIK
jgi:hypothetical protein